MSKENEGYSNEDSGRRKFLKTLGGGVVGAGAFAMMPSVSGFSIKSDSLDFIESSSGSSSFSVDSSGVMDVDQLGKESSPVNTIYSDSVRADEINNKTYVSTEQELKEALQRSGPVEIVIEDDITVTSVLPWEELSNDSYVRGVDKPKLSFEHSSSEPAMVFDGQARITFERIWFSIPKSGVSEPIIQFNVSKWGPFKFAFRDCLFSPKGGGRAVKSNDKNQKGSHSHVWENCDFIQMNKASNPPIAYVTVGGTHQRFWGTRFLDIPDGSYGIHARRSGSAWTIIGSKFGGSNSGSGINLRDSIDGMGVPQMDAFIAGCSFEGLNRESGSGEYAMKIYANTTVQNCTIGKVTKGIVTGFSEGKSKKSTIKQINFFKIEDEHIDASSAGDHYIEVDSVDGLRTKGDSNIIHSSKLLKPQYINMGGSSGTISPPLLGVSRTNVKVDPDGSGVNLKGIDNITKEGETVLVRKAGSENLILKHNASVENPLMNQSNSDIELGSNSDVVAYHYVGGKWRQAWSTIS